MFEELDFQRTSLGELVLRRRESISRPGLIVYEVTLDGEFLMSSAVNDSEIALAELGLAALEGGPWEVMVAGLGLGYTAAAALKHQTVRRVTVVEYLEPVLQWHRKGLVPLGAELTGDPRCEFLLADFFEVMRSPPKSERDRYDAILVDIDHSPEALLQPANAAFYAKAGMANLARHLKPRGVLALWSADAPAPGLLDDVRSLFSVVEARPIHFYNPFMGEEDCNTVLLAVL
jgi:spermidine synthase